MKYKPFCQLIALGMFGLSNSYAQTHVDSILNNILTTDKNVVLVSPPKSAPIPAYQSAPVNKIDPIDPKSYSAMQPYPWLDKGWKLSSTATEQDILKQEILRLQQVPQFYISPGPSLKKGMTSPRVREVTTALSAYKLLSPEHISDTFDQTVEEAIKKFQATHNLTADGIAGAQTIAYLASQNRDKKLAALQWAVNNPRITPYSQGKSIIVNLAAQQLRAYDNGNLVLTSRTIVGKPVTRTPLMSDYIESVTLNPIWVAPKSISDRLYSGQKTIVPAGPSNPLGKLRIDMYNPELIYLHHTNHPELFQKNKRTFSSGCVRVEKAYSLSQWLAGSSWFSYGSDNILKTNQEVKITLENKVPVYLEYRPVEVTSAGKVVYYKDPYAYVPGL